MRRFAILLACCVGFYLLLFQVFRTLTDVGELRKQFPRVIYERETDATKIVITPNRPPQWVSLKEISPIAVSAVVISEDDAFWQHNGFNFDQLWDAFETNLKAGRYVRGGSTITQQVVKNVYLSKEKTITRKVKEAILTIRLERLVGKRRILEVYLNIAEFGPGIFGIGSAARYYFQKPAASLNAKEGAFLAMLLPSPKRYGASFRKKALTPFARGAVKNIMEKLLVTGRISEEQYRDLLATPLSFEAVAEAPPAADEAPPADEDDSEESAGSPDISGGGQPDSSSEAPAST